MDHVRSLVITDKVTAVLAQDRDRFAREPAYHYLLRKKFEEHDCMIKALNDRGDDSPEGELTDGIIAKSRSLSGTTPIREPGVANCARRVRARLWPTTLLAVSITQPETATK